ncbi:unnamed protein product [Angiostrongylus costaricensis]|uniref:Zinc-hook domain-containing protein n=1 Tax=Angiostrongylus costaricensis TaxID=334426 RepID=A0A158PF98_ANGCS|nr:unnamed protein product [Angiostrongylus costaricensis]
MDSSSELHELESKRNHLKKKIESISRDIILVKKEKQEAECEIRKAMGMEMVCNDLQNEVHKIENELVSAYGFHGPNYVDELRNRISSEEKEMEDLKIELLRERCLNAEKFEEAKFKMERKQSEKDEIELRLKTFLEKHTGTFLLAFGEVAVGPWSTDVNRKLKSVEDSNVAAESELKRYERDLDRANQVIEQSKVEEQKLLSEVEQLKEKISDLCNCSPHDVVDSLSETRHLLSKSRKELASLSTKALLYESWSEETKKRLCCPLCERRFSNKGGAGELSGKLLDMSLSMPHDIERLERQVQEAEEKERRLANALVFVDQCKKIMEEKVRFVRKRISDYMNEEATLTEKVQQLRETHTKGISFYKQLLEVKADVSLMDSLLSSLRTLTIELDKLRENLSDLPHSFPLSELHRDIGDKELHTFKERRISLGEFAAQSTHIQQSVAKHRADIAKLTERHREIVEQDLPRARNVLNHSKRRILEDQLTRKLIESKIAKTEQELSEVACIGNDKEGFYRQREKAIKERDESSLEKARLTGQLEEVDKKINEASLALSSKEMKQAEGLYHEVIIEKIVTQEMITDLEKYMQCLDTCIIQFHTEKMIAINRILEDLWRKVYDGTDIHSISIKSECAASSEKRKVYDYRVVMVVRNNVELDMRDRCSAGQKMLACILIRLALADVFGGMCSIIALDEPTTNLDALKVISGVLAKLLSTCKAWFHISVIGDRIFSSSHEF